MKKLLAYLAVIVFLSFLVSCGNERDTEQVKDENADLSCEIDNLEEDLYFAYKALTQIDSLLNHANLDSAKVVSKAALKNLGDGRFFKDNIIAIDVLTLNTVYLDTTITNFSRRLRYQDFEAKRDTLIKYMKKEHIRITK